VALVSALDAHAAVASSAKAIAMQAHQQRIGDRQPVAHRARKPGLGLSQLQGVRDAGGRPRVIPVRTSWMPGVRWPS
jgi:hypothetical protein